MGKNYKPAVIVADPPWAWPSPYRETHSLTVGQKRQHPRPEHQWFQDGKVLPCDRLGAATIPTQDNACLFLWCPSSRIGDALSVMHSWGFQYKTCLIWVKTTKDGKPLRVGVGWWVGMTHEVVLFGIKGKPPAPYSRFSSTFFHPRIPAGVHGRKPEVLQEWIESAFPGPYLELFATQRRKGWLAFGEGFHDVSIPEWEMSPPIEEDWRSTRLKGG